MTEPTRDTDLCQRSMTDYFQDEVARTASELRSPVPADAQLYLADLMVRFASTDRLYEVRDGKREEEPLAFILRRALELDEDGRIRTLKHLGDIALFTSGVFPERVERRGVELDYYIQMGGMAYSNVATLATHRARGMGFADLYAKLAEHFRDLVTVLWEVADHARANTTQGLLELYRKWEQTKSARLARKLTKSGFILGPNGRPCEC